MKLDDAITKAQKLSKDFQTNAVVYRWQMDNPNRIVYDAKLEEYHDEDKDGDIWMTYSKGNLVIS